ncbi:MAG TPA: phosphohistidine phosphatase SixA [Acidobacteriaceae bacterium]|jgi:phosphohistidine phosphatase|nr:phosphohistidine phosphatase SixA [Acidobacteriaceae bacterium]
MNLYILRHASAGTRRANPVIDVKRPLDKEGKQQSLLVGRFLSSLNVQFDRVVSSPLKRALQTASLVSNETGYDAKIEVSSALSPEAGVPKFHELIRGLEKYDNVLVVGHNPNIPVFLGSLLAPSARISTRLRKGAIARIDCTRVPGTLHWLVDPRILRGIYSKATKRSRPKTSRK